MGQVDLAELIHKTLQSTHYCVLSTVDSAGRPWANPVYFAYDEDFNFYFMSLMHSRHMQNLLASPQVAVAVFSTAQVPGEHVTGVQFSGQANLVVDDDVPEVCDVYFARDGAMIAVGLEEIVPADFQGEEPEKWKFVRIVPQELSLFASEHFGEERVDVPLDVVR